MGRGRQKRGRKPQHATETWMGYMAAKKSKLDNQFEDGEERETDGIFSGVAIYVNGYTDPTAHELKAIMLSNGGKFHHYYSHSKTTHVVASNLPNSKINSIGSKLIVNPQWIVESVQAGKLLDYSKYLLYTRPHVGQSVIKFSEPAHLDGLGAATTQFKEVGTKSMLSTSPIHAKANSISAVDTGSGQQICTLEYPTSASDIMKPVANPTASMSSANPKFISEFYNNSRLHHISIIAALLKDYVKKLQKSEEPQHGLLKYKKWLAEKSIEHEPEFNPQERVIMHADMDCFFVSVGVRKRPHLIGKPVAVTHSKGNRASHTEGMNRQAEFDLYKERKEKKDKNLYLEDAESSEDSMGEIEGVRIEKKDHCLIDETSSMSEIASCSYEARSIGIKNGMFVGSALKICPHLHVIPYDFEEYKDVSYSLYDCVSSVTKNIEAVSCDEMFIDATEILNETRSKPSQLAYFLREQIFTVTQCHCSVGIGPNMLLARLATRKAKPNGIFCIDPSQSSSFILSQNVSNLPGVGYTLSGSLKRLGLSTCTDLQQWSIDKLQESFGVKTGQSLFNYCRGIDQRPLNKEHERKSVSAEVNFGIRFKNLSDSKDFFLKLSGEVSSRLKALNLSGKSVTLKLKVRAAGAPAETAKFMGHGVCDNITRSVTLPVVTSDQNLIYNEVIALLKKTSVQPEELRGVGIQVSKLEEPLDSSAPSIRHLFEQQKAKTIDIKTPVIQSMPGPSGSGVLKTLDMSVLESLPVDMRAEIVAEYRSQGYLIPDSIASAERPSKIQKLAAQSPIKCVSPVKNTPERVGRSLSEINNSFLNALPEDLRLEICQDIEHSKNTAALPESPNRGRGTCQKSIDVKKRTMPRQFGTLIKTDDQTKWIDSQQQRVETVINPEFSNPKPPSFCGETNLTEIKKLILQWIASCDCPDTDDVQEVTSFCHDLMLGKDLETINLFLRFLKRKLGCLPTWKGTLEEIIESVQENMLRIYQAKLWI